MIHQIHQTYHIHQIHQIPQEVEGGEDVEDIEEPNKKLKIFKDRSIEQNYGAGRNGKQKIQKKKRDSINSKGDTR